MIVKSKVKKMLLKGAAFLIFLFIVGAGCKLMVGPPDYIVLKKYESPSGEHVAELSYTEWGAWGYSYCLEKVTVRRIGSELLLADPPKIYSGHCYGRKPTDEAFVKWVSARLLQITLYVARLEGEGYSFQRAAMPDGLKADLKLKLD